VYDAVSESALIEELKVGAYAGWQPWFAPADDNGPDEQLARTGAILDSGHAAD